MNNRLIDVTTPMMTEKETNMMIQTMHDRTIKTYVILAGKRYDFEEYSLAADDEESVECISLLDTVIYKNTFTATG